MTIKLVTLNVWGLPEPLAADTAPRMQAIADRVAMLDADIVAFQEVWTGSAKRTLMENNAYSAGWYHQKDFGGGGILVLSRLPIRQARFEAYGLRGLPQRIHHGDYFARKGFLHLQLATEDGPVSIITTHIHAPYDSDGSSEYAGIQAGQLVQLANYLTTISDPLVVAGDFNIRPGSRHYQAFRGLTAVEDVAVSLRRREATVRRTNPYRTNRRSPDARVNYVFYRSGATQRVSPLSIEQVFDDTWQRDGRQLSYSNHCGLLAELDIEGRTPSSLPVPRPEAIDTARAMLEEGKALAKKRQERQRMMAGVSTALGSLYFSRSLRRRLSRRRFLKVSLAALPVVAYPSAVGLLTLSEMFTPRELRAYDDMLRLLDGLEGPGRHSAPARWQSGNAALTSESRDLRASPQPQWG